jgi:hypothetical protein
VTEWLRRALDVSLVVGIVGFALLLLSDQVERARHRSARDRVVREAGQLYDAMQRYFERHGSYPASYGNDALEPETLEPLKRRGYYAGRLPGGCEGERIDGYGAPARDEFWLEMTLASTPPLRLVVARSDDAPSGGGLWLEGVYVHEDRRLHRR